MGDPLQWCMPVDIKCLPEDPLHVVHLRPSRGKSARGRLLVKVFAGLPGTFWDLPQVYVANTCTNDVTIPVGSILCGYGKGWYDRNKNGDFKSNCHLMYKINTCDDFVFTSKMATVKEVVAEQRSNNPEAKIAYHSMFDIASNDKHAFGVKQDHEIFFTPAFPTTLTQRTLAAELPANTFRSSDYVVQTWKVKWGPLGLTPVKPLVLFKQSCDLPAGKALRVM